MLPPIPGEVFFNDDMIRRSIRSRFGKKSKGKFAGIKNLRIFDLSLDNDVS